MANQLIEPQPGDVADERGKFAPAELPEDEAMASDTGVDEIGIHESFSDTPPTQRTRTQGAAIDDLADPDADANLPEPSKPIAMNAGRPSSSPRNIPGGGSSDSPDLGDRGTSATDDEEAGAVHGVENAIRSGSHVTEDDTRDGPTASHSAEYPSVSQPTNVTQFRHL
jgi:hypothetical protein